MTIRHLPGIALAVTASIGLAQAASAGTTVINAAGWVEGSAALTDDFLVPGAGTLTVTLQDYVFPSTLQSVGFTLYGTSAASPHLMGSMSGAGVEQFNIAAGQRLSAQLYAVAGGAANIGLYGWTMTFAPVGSPVPLPWSSLLLASGLGALGWIAGGRKRPEAPAKRLK